MNYYDVLRVNKNASSQEIKDSYKKLIKRYHPDLYPGNKVRAESITRDLNEAYEVLSDPEKREMYDLSLNPPVIEYYKPTEEKSHSTYKRVIIEEIEEKPNFQETMRENIHEFVDKHSENLNKDTKLKVVMIVIFVSLLILALTAKDYIDFQFTIQKKQLEREQLIQNKIQENILNENTTTTNDIDI